MKKLMLFPLLAALAGCGAGADHPITASADHSGQLAGTYYKRNTDQRGTVQHMVVITPMPGTHTYQVRTKNVIDQIWDGQKVPTEIKEPAPKLATYDPVKSILVIDGAAAYSVDLQAHTITKGKLTLPKQP